MRRRIDLYELLPAVYRIDDAARGYPLKALLDIISEQANVVEQDISNLWDDFFIETAERWVIPYIGDLVGNIPIHEVTRGQRADVARTIHFRRRKGTVPVLEEMARYVTGWSVHVVEFFDIMTWTQNMNHLRPGVGTVDLRDLGDLRGTDADDLRRLRGIDAVDRIQTAFDSVSHSADIRPTESDAGWHNIPKVGFFIWRLDSYQLMRVMPRRSGAAPHGYHFSPLGNPAHMFNSHEPSTGEEGLIEERAINGPIRPTAFYFDLASYYRSQGPGGLPAGISIFNGAVRYEPSQIMCKNLDDWARPPAGMVAVDVRLGRFTFAAGEEPADPLAVRVSYCHGFSGDLGGGPYDRAHLRDPDTITDPDMLDALFTVEEGGLATIGAALAAWGGASGGNPPERAVIEISDSRTYTENITLDKVAEELVIQARNNERTVIMGNIVIEADAPSEVILDGLVLAGRIEVSEGSNLTKLRLLHCTLVPGMGLDEGGSPASPSNPPSLIVGARNSNLDVKLERCITGPLRIPQEVDALTVVDSIIDSPGQAEATHTPVLVSSPISSPVTLTSTTPTFQLSLGDSAFLPVQLSGAPSTPAQVRDAVQAGIRVHPNPAFAQAQVVLAGNRLVIVPGVSASIHISPYIAGGSTDPTLSELRLDSTSARKAYGLVSAPLPNNITDRERRLTATIEADDGTEGTQVVTVPPGAATLSALVPILQTALRASSASALFTGVMVSKLQDRLLIIAGGEDTTLYVTAAPGDTEALAELGLASARVAIGGNYPGTLFGPPTTLQSVTIFGQVAVKELTLASETIFMGSVRAERRQAGCVRFSYVPDGSETPRRYRCQPDITLEGITDAGERALAYQRLVPVFTTWRYGQPAYGQLALLTADEIATGAEDGAEMGAFHYLMQPQRVANLRIRLDEYLPLGLEPALIFVT